MSDKRPKTEAAEFLAFIRAGAREVDGWPEWKKVLFPEKSLPEFPVVQATEQAKPRKKRGVTAR